MAFIPDEVKPLKGFHLPALLRKTAERYQSVNVPSVEDARTAGAKFQNGTCRCGGGEIPFAQIAIHNDALSVVTTDSDDSELVLNDLYDWLKEEFLFREPSTPPIRSYQSDRIRPGIPVIVRVTRG